jgi:GNAT superfamily N-acetyltransferase
MDTSDRPRHRLDSDGVSLEEAAPLYESVGWTAYTRDPAVLEKALAGSSFVVAARSDDGALVGLARVISDDATICYLQDILVHPDHRHAGVGRALVERVKRRYAHVRQTVLITDDEPAQRAFYEATGFTEGAGVRPHPLRMFALFR